MKTKLIKIHNCDTAGEVLLFTQWNNKGEVQVTLQCWHEIDDSDIIQSEEIIFPSLIMASCFISDYSENAANEFANSYSE